jgi:hypothetical protein
LTAAGCFGGGTKVTGAVNLDGRPLAEAKVLFVPKTNRKLPSSFTRTDAEGRFRLDRHCGQPLRPGKYAVLITKYVDKTGKVPDTEEADQPDASGELRNLVPARYNDADRSPLVVDIKEGENALPTFDLRR